MKGKTSLVEALAPDVYYAFVAARRRWAAWRAKTVEPSEALACVGRRIKVRGVVEPLEKPLVAQFSMADAVFYEVVLAEQRTERLDFQKRSEWKELYRDASTAPFLLAGADGTKLLVEPAIAVHTLESVALPAAENGRRTEARLAPGDVALVYGLVDEVGSVVHSGYRVEAATMPRIRGTVEEPVVISRGAAPK